MTELLTKIDPDTCVRPCPHNGKVTILVMFKAGRLTLVGCNILDSNDLASCNHLHKVRRGCPFLANGWMPSDGAVKEG